MNVTLSQVKKWCIKKKKTSKFHDPNLAKQNRKYDHCNSILCKTNADALLHPKIHTASVSILISVSFLKSYWVKKAVVSTFEDSVISEEDSLSVGVCLGFSTLRQAQGDTLFT